jgi:hypothetical protein
MYVTIALQPSLYDTRMHEDRNLGKSEHCSRKYHKSAAENNF